MSVNAFSESAENEAERAMVDLGLPAVVARADDRRVAMRAFACFLRAVIAGAVSSQSTGYRVQGELGRAHSMAGGTGYRVQGERSRQSSSSARAAIASRFLLRPCLSPLLHAYAWYAHARAIASRFLLRLRLLGAAGHLHMCMQACMHTPCMHTPCTHTPCICMCMRTYIQAHVSRAAGRLSTSPLVVPRGPRQHAREVCMYTSCISMGTCPRGVHVHIMHKHGYMPVRCACTHHA